MNTCVSFFIFLIHIIIVSEIFGRKIHISNPGSSDAPKSFSYIPTNQFKRKPDIYQEINNKALQKEHLLRLNILKPTKPSPIVPILNAIDGNDLDFSTDYETLMLEVDNKVVKVKSKLESKSLEAASKIKGTKMTVNPKYSHVIEIIHKGDIFPENELKETQIDQVSVEKNNLEQKTDDISIPEEIKTDAFTDHNAIDSESFTGSVDLNSDLDSEFEGSGVELSNSEDHEDTSKSGRFLGVFSRQNETLPFCTTPKGEDGHCRRIRHCLLSDALNNFNVFLQHLCIIRGALVGVCCPDNPVVEISSSDKSNTQAVSVEIKQPPEGCGLNSKTRIVGGKISVPHEWTWMVALLKRNRFYCGGVIINNWYILTAAHCVLGIDLKDLTVRLGEYDFNAGSSHQEDIGVSEIKRHAQFVTLTFQHDIALLKLKRSVKYSKFVGSICLPDQKAGDYSDATGTVVGWGTVSFGGAASPILRQVTVPVWKNEDCDRTYLLENISDSFMCAGSPEKGEDACQGDSGGPLMTLNELGRWEVIGIVSWGRRCGDPTYPGVYTRVTTYLDWINQNIK